MEQPSNIFVGIIVKFTPRLTGLLLAKIFLGYMSLMIMKYQMTGLQIPLGYTLML